MAFLEPRDRGFRVSEDRLLGRVQSHAVRIALFVRLIVRVIRKPAHAAHTSIKLNKELTMLSDSKLQTIVLTSRPDEAEAAYRAASPLDQVTSTAPPWLVIHGAQDAVVPPHESRQFFEKLTEVSESPAIYAELPGATHTFDIVHSIRTHITISGIARFAEHVVSRDEEIAR